MTLRQAEEQYVLGQTNYLTVLVALRNLQQLEQQKISAQRQWLSHRVLLCRALGGSWALPEPKEPQDPRASAPAAREPSAATLVSAQHSMEGER
jgi:outer membrane protein TolC